MKQTEELASDSGLHERGSGSSIDKALDVLFALHAEGGSLGVSALGRALGMPRSSVHRLVRPLVGRGLVEQDGQGKYRPGFGLVALGRGVLGSDPVVGAARPLLEEQVRELGETVFLTGLREGRIVVLDKAEGTGWLRAAPEIGASVPVHATAVGKLWLALAPDDVRPPAALERFTARTVADASRLAREVASARRKGWAANVEEWIAGLSVVAAPICPAGRMVAALAVASSTPRMRELDVQGVALRLRTAADRVARRLSGEAS